MTQPGGDEPTIRVLVVDDHEMVRSGLATFLASQADMELAGMASSGEEAIALCDVEEPDVVLMDLVMPGMDGIAATRQILAAHPQVKVIALTSYHEKDRVRQALEARVAGYILKDTAGDELAEVVRRVYAGQTAIAPDVMRVLVSTLTNGSSPADFHLTPRELDVLTLLAQGRSNTEIARDLGIKASTVKTHVSRVFAKMNVSSRVEAATLAVGRNLVDD